MQIGFNLLTPTFAQGPSAFDDNKTYIMRERGGECELGSTINSEYDDTLQAFLIYSLPYEWHPASDLEAYKAGAVAIRTFALNGRHYEEYIKDGQTYRCVYVYQMYGFNLDPRPEENPNQYPLALQAISETNGIYIIHPQAKALEDYLNPTFHSQGAIDAQFRAETGRVTLESTDPNDFLYLHSISDPISPPLAPDLGLGQNGASRLAVGKRLFTLITTTIPFPVFNYLQILTHYYTGVDIVQDDGQGNLTVLTPQYRWLPLQIKWDTPDNTPPLMQPGQTYTATVHFLRNLHCTSSRLGV